jgi:hypothetical protein
VDPGLVVWAFSANAGPTGTGLLQDAGVDDGRACEDSLHPEIATWGLAGAKDK